MSGLCVGGCEGRVRALASGVCVQGYIVGVNVGVKLDGHAGLYLLATLRRKGLWRHAEATLLCEFSHQLALEPFARLTSALHSLDWHGGAATAPRQAAAAATVASGALTANDYDSQVLLDALWGLALGPSPPMPGPFPAGDGSGPLQYPMAAVTWRRARDESDKGGGEASDDSYCEDGDSDAGEAGMVKDSLATQCCNVLLQAYAEATPPQAVRAHHFLCTMVR